MGVIPDEFVRASDSTILDPRALPERLQATLGGRTRAKAVGLMAAVFALESADLSAVGTTATQLEKAFRIGHAQLGLLVSVSLAVGAITTLPFGVLADRVRRVRVLAVVVAVWSVAMLAGAAAPSYGALLVSRVGLGVAAAAAVPVVASLIGDLFEPEERSRIYAYILTGDFIGSAFGVLLSGGLAAVSWRLAFGVLAVPSALLAWVLLRHLGEPRRRRRARSADDEPEGARREALERGVQPAEDRVLAHAGYELSLRAAIRYVLRVPTNRTLIVASALGYFYFAGMRTFALAFLRGRYGVGQSTATLLLMSLGVGAVIGVLAAGRIADRRLERGELDARIVVPGVAYLAGAAVLLAGLLVGSLGIAMVFYVAGAALLSAPNAPLDAARLDVMPSALWGRAESVRTVLRQGAQAVAPVTFGVLADALGPPGTDQVAGTGLRYALLILLSALVISGAVVLSARRQYPRDAATAAASQGS